MREKTLTAAMRGGSDLDYKLWFTGEITEDTPCSDDRKNVILTATSDADTAAIEANPSDYALRFNDTDLPIFGDDSDEGFKTLMWGDVAPTATKGVMFEHDLSEDTKTWAAIAFCDFTGDVNIYVAHK